MSVSIRTLLDVQRPYWMFNREERNYAALLYTALLSGDNLDRFLRHVGCTFPVVRDEVGVYVEYAYLRDLWLESGGSNDEKRRLIIELLDTEDVKVLAGASTLEWNQHFGVNSPDFIQSPATWQLRKFHLNIESTEDLLATCKFKWSFKIKPDVVIHTSNDHAIVIEAKYKSREGRYPADKNEIAIFRARRLDIVRQTALQKYLFEELLGVQGTYIYVVQDPKARSGTHDT